VFDSGLSTISPWSRNVPEAEELPFGFDRRLRFFDLQLDTFVAALKILLFAWTCWAVLVEELNAFDY
jgi:hypothetical protein